MFSDVLNIKGASPENKDAFYGGRKEATTKFCLSVFLLREGLRTFDKLSG